MSCNEKALEFEGYDFSQLPQSAQQKVRELWQQICDLEKEAANTTGCDKIKIRGQIAEAQGEIRKIYCDHTDCESAHILTG